MISLYDIELYWIRHAYSCSNLVGDTIGNTDILNGILFPRAKYSFDAQLTDYGIVQTQETRSREKDLFGKMDIVLTSQLRRSIETAINLFKDNDITIYPVPYVNEIRFHVLKLLNADLDNQSIGLTSLMAYLREKYGNLSDKIDFSLSREQYGTADSDINKFFTIAIPELIKSRPDKFITGKTVKICVVSHQLFIENRLRALWKHGPIPKVSNVDIFLENITVTLDNNYRLVNVKHNAIDVCNGDYICKISNGLIDFPGPFESFFMRCNDDLKNRLKSNSQYWYDKYIAKKHEYMRLKKDEYLNQW
jgi:broad specificity phosphatase PhoE